MATPRPRIPHGEPLVDRQGLMRLPWVTWFRGLRTDLDSTPRAETTPITVTGQSAAIGLTAIPTATLPAGLYLVTAFLRVTTAAGVSSSVTLTITFTSGGVTCTFSGAALTANATNAPQAHTWLLKIDAATPVSYSTAYVSNPAAAMRYELSIVFQRIDA
ncbi:MAG TPA: hypothetical protein VEC57_15080 [Candidatus Limnocylindrales bacterium]|nr:hypothetical protein [Candidatus Limnocylindrales bacterium]